MKKQAYDINTKGFFSIPVVIEDPIDPADAETDPETEVPADTDVPETDPTDELPIG